MRTLEAVINYDTAPLVQWEPVVGAPLSAGKRHEDALTHRAICTRLFRENARHITGIIADEARLELHLQDNLPHAAGLTHLTLPGVFQSAAAHNVETAARPGAQTPVIVTSDIDAVPPQSQDAVVLNMILGCLATSNAHENITAMLRFAGSLLKPGGALVVVRPNPEGGKFSTYECTTPACYLKAGEDYDFKVDGLGTMRNLYTPDTFLRGRLAAANFTMDRAWGIADTSRPETFGRPPAFLINVCRYRGPGNQPG